MNEGLYGLIVGLILDTRAKEGEGKCPSPW